MRSTFVAAVTLAVATLVAFPAFAHGAGGAKFPMPAATFKSHVDTRLARAQKRMEERASALPADQAKDLRAKFAAGAAKVNAAVASATADGTVTKDEARVVREAMRTVRPHGGHGKHARKHDASKKPAR